MKDDVKFEYVSWKNVRFYFIFYCSGSLQSQNWEILILKVIEILFSYNEKMYDVRFYHVSGKNVSFFFDFYCLSSVQS